MTAAQYRKKHKVSPVRNNRVKKGPTALFVVGSEQPATRFVQTSAVVLEMLRLKQSPDVLIAALHALAEMNRSQPTTVSNCTFTSS